MTRVAVSEGQFFQFFHLMRNCPKHAVVISSADPYARTMFVHLR